jgi:hypothetical protein
MEAVHSARSTMSPQGRRGAGQNRKRSGLSPEREDEVAKVREFPPTMPSPGPPPRPKDDTVADDLLMLRVNQLIGATNPLLALFAAVDDVFTEDDAMSPEKRQMSLGRIYRQWKKTRAELGGDNAGVRDRRDPG